MNKIISWVFGSFFRTFGRIIAYLFIGLAIGYILNKMNIKWSIPSILYTNVYAESINIRQTADGYLLINDSTNEYLTYIINPNSNAVLRVKIATALSESDTYSYMFMDVCSTRDIDAIRTSSPGQSCGNSCWSNQVFTEKTNYLCTTNAQNGYIYRITTPIQKWEKDFNDEMAYVNDQLTIRNLTTDIISTTIYGVYVSNDTNNGTVNINYTDIINNIGNRQITAIDAVTSATNNVAETARENTEDIINSITDDNIDENATSEFVNGLDKEYSSLTPFSDFINLPLTWIQSLFSSQNSCVPIDLPLPYLENKNLTLPCMTEFWERMGALGTLIQMVWIAIVGVRIFNGLFLLTCETLDPNPDKDMTKLRTWEL